MAGSIFSTYRFIKRYGGHGVLESLYVISTINEMFTCNLKQLVGVIKTPI